MSFTPSSNQEETDSPERKKYLQRQYEGMQSDIRKQSARLKLGDLRLATSKPGTELRVWVGFGLSIPDCFILRTGNENHLAYYLPATAGIQNAKPASKKRVAIDQFALGPPKSGWDEFDRFLKDQGIDSTISLSPDKDAVAIPDGGDIAIELKSGTGYNMVFFSLYTESQDGQKALALCRRIEHEFSIELGCETPTGSASAGPG